MTTVLVVDDSALARRSLRRILEAAGFKVSEAHDGMAAIEAYFLEKPDLVVLDLVMAQMYGLEVLQRLGELDPDARVIVVTADIQQSSRDQAMAAGARAFISKPVDADELLGAIRAVSGEKA